MESFVLVDSEERRVNHDCCVRSKEEENTVTNVIAEIMAAETDWQILRLSPVPLPDPFIPLSDAKLLYEVRKVYLKLSLALHPDRCADPLCEEAFKKVVCARDNILNGKKRPRAPNTSRNSAGGGEGAGAADEGVQKEEKKSKKLTRPQKRRLRSLNKREKELIRRLVSIEKQKEDALHRVRAYELEVSAAKRRGVRIAFHESQIPSLLGKENVRWLDGRWVTAGQAVELCLNSSTDEIIQFGEKLRECRKTFLTSHRMSGLSHLRIPAYSQIKIARLKERKAIFDHDKARKELLSIEDKEKLVLREIKLSIHATNEFLKSCT